MDFLAALERQFQRAGDWAWFPPEQAATAMDGFMEEDVLALTAEQKQFVIESLANGRAPFVHREEARLQNIYNLEFSLVYAGEQTMEKALATIQEAGKKSSTNSSTDQ